MDNIKYLDDNWEGIESTIVRYIYNAYQEQYEYFGIEYDDFCNTAYLILRQAAKTYKSDKAGFGTYCNKVLRRKMYSYIRDNFNTDKRCANIDTRSFSESLNDTGETTLADIVPMQTLEDNSDPNKIKKYLDKLSDLQKNIIIFKILGFSNEDITESIGVDKKTINTAIKSMQIYEKISILRNRRKTR